MLFNSYPFLFGFLPLALAVFFLLGKYRPQLAIPWLAMASVAFYAYWDWRFVPVFAVSVVANYTFGRLLLVCGQSYRGYLLFVALLANLSLLGYYKYFDFLLGELAHLLDLAPRDTSGWVLPLGISFFTFTQIAYLVDVSRGEAQESKFWHYLLFVSYFPHLIAGPVLHHAQMMPQFSSKGVFSPRADHIAQGLTVFSVGLAKKVLLADTLAAYASPVFDAAAKGAAPGFVESWTGALAYTLQLYFDFSGYSDMAIGLSLMFNIRLPINFQSPYRAANIIDFWRRWHITLSHFLRDYLYIPLGGGHRGKVRRYVNLLATMLLGGLWHGAGWTFVVWGGLHGVFLVFNHAWRALIAGSPLDLIGNRLPLRVAYTAITFICVVVGWVVFRADSLASASRILTGMAGGHGVVLPGGMQHYLAPFLPTGIPFGNASELLQLPLFQAWSVICGGLLVVFLLPNVNQWMAGVQISCEPATATSALPRVLVWAGRRHEAWFAGLLFGASILSLTRVSEFLYFQF